jgi:hypothetical protein
MDQCSNNQASCFVGQDCTGGATCTPNTGNVGIEVGQLLFVGLVLPARVALGLLPVPWPRASALIPGYAVGSLAVSWVLERVWGTFF